MAIELTGRRRFREQRRLLRPSLLVLQLEERHHGTHEHVDRAGFVDIVPYDDRRWRDARVQDLTDGKGAAHGE